MGTTKGYDWTVVAVQVFLVAVLVYVVGGVFLPALLAAAASIQSMGGAS